MSRIIKSRRALVLGVVAALGIVAAAIAYWTTSGTGTGSATAGDASAVSVTQVGSITGLVPGGDAQPVSFKINNPKTTPQYVTSVTVSIDSITKDGSAVAGSACSAADFTLVQPTATFGDLSAGDHTYSPAGTASGATLKMEDTGSNQDGCKGVTINLGFSAV
jgi:hypothetical protein